MPKKSSRAISHPNVVQIGVSFYKPAPRAGCNAVSLDGTQRAAAPRAGLRPGFRGPVGASRRAQAHRADSDSEGGPASQPEAALDGIAAREATASRRRPGWAGARRALTSSPAPRRRVAIQRASVCGCRVRPGRLRRPLRPSDPRPAAGRPRRESSAPRPAGLGGGAGPGRRSLPARREGIVRHGGRPSAGRSRRYVTMDPWSRVDSSAHDSTRPDPMPGPMAACLADSDGAGSTGWPMAVGTRGTGWQDLCAAPRPCRTDSGRRPSACPSPLRYPRGA